MAAPSSFLLLMSMVAFYTATAKFNPSLTVDSCTAGRLIVTVKNAEPDGIIYVQGQGAACKQTTSNGTVQHTIEFAACNIKWQERFVIIIQKRAQYQNGQDKQIPIMCSLDLSELSVSTNINVLDKHPDPGLNKTVKPRATMALIKDGKNIAGETVTLTDIITMVLKLDSEYRADFEIMAKSCAASTIELVNEFCPVNTDLFPRINHIQQGKLSATFGAFRTTDLNGGIVAMPFTCTLRVCLGACPAAQCFVGDRGVREIGTENAQVDSITVGSTIYIKSDKTHDGHAETISEKCKCANQGVCVAMVVLLIIVLVVLMVISAIVLKVKNSEKEYQCVDKTHENKTYKYGKGRSRYSN